MVPGPRVQGRGGAKGASAAAGEAAADPAGALRDAAPEAAPRVDAVLRPQQRADLRAALPTGSDPVDDGADLAGDVRQVLARRAVPGPLERRDDVV